MTSHLNVNLDYDKEALLAMFNAAEKTVLPRYTKAELDPEVVSSGIIRSYLDHFPYIPHNIASIDLVIRTRDERPHITPANNGYIIFPVSGSVLLKTYSYNFADPTNNSVYAIKSTDELTPSMLLDIEATLVDTIKVDSPIAVDGNTVHAVVSEDGTQGSIALYLKIPLGVTWEEAVAAMKEAGLVA